jgi:hypothetical protein
LAVACLVLRFACPDALPDVGRTVRISPPAPILQTNPRSQLEAVRAAEEKRLNTYYWIDRASGVVHIPIEQAMQNVARAGLPGFGSTPAAAKPAGDEAPAAAAAPPPGNE